MRGIFIRRYVSYAVVFIAFIFIASLIFTSATESRLPGAKGHWRSSQSKNNGPPLAKPPKSDDRADAALIMLVRNSELDLAIGSIRDLERTFNGKFNYPWIFFNDEDFTSDFKEKTATLTKAKVQYERIPKEHWDIPDWIHPDLLEASFDRLEAADVKYHHLTSYRQMCRWNSGMFYRHPALEKIKWYWRVEPEVQFFCDIDYDVFKFMEMHGKTYGFVINIYDSPQSIETLWTTVEEFVAEYPQYVHANNSLHWLKDSSRPGHYQVANGYSTCHFWSNFEIANMDFWRSQEYEAFFSTLDRSGGFFYERWGDAPVHSIALGLMEDKNNIHYFDDIGYRHIPYWNCPKLDTCSADCAYDFTDGTGLDQEDCKPIWFDNVNRESAKLKEYM